MGAANKLLNSKGKRGHRAFRFLSPLDRLVIFPGAQALQSGSFEKPVRIGSRGTPRSLAK
jgi:hypothetical protein